MDRWTRGARRRRARGVPRQGARARGGVREALPEREAGGRRARDSRRQVDPSRAVVHRPQRARAARHSRDAAGKDYMSDKPGITTLEQLAEVRRVQAATKRIYSILYSERLENASTVRAGELVKAGRDRQSHSDGRPRSAPRPSARPRRSGSGIRRSTAASSATSARISSTNSCSSPARRAARSSRRRCATFAIRIIRRFRTSAT